MANIGIYNALLQQPKSIADYNAIADEADMRQQTMQQNALALQTNSAAYQEAQRQRNVARQHAELAKSFGPDPQKNAEMILAKTGDVKYVQAYLQGEALRAKEAAQTRQAATAADNSATENVSKVFQRYQREAGNARTPQELAQNVYRQYQDPVTRPEVLKQEPDMMKAMSRYLNLTPKEFPDVQQKYVMGMKDFLDHQQKAVTAVETARSNKVREAETARHNPVMEDAAMISARARTLSAQAAQSAEKAPTLADVIDPSDPTRMLKINTRGGVYKGGSLGSPGVIGIAGKEPSAQARIAKEETKAQAKADAVKAADDVISSLSGYYATLDTEGAITSTKKGTVANIGSAISSSGIGQIAGGAVGSRAQSARDSIAQTRPLLLSTLKDALGLTAQQLNSDKELQLWLSAATNPKMSLESNRDALKNIARRIGIRIGIQPSSTGDPEIDSILKKHEAN